MLTGSEMQQSCPDVPPQEKPCEKCGLALQLPQMGMPAILVCIPRSLHHTSFMKIHGWLGLLLLITSWYCLLHRIEPFTTWFYCFAWWSYILLADGLLLKLRGRSLLAHKRREFCSMLFISVFIWLLFEAYNFSLQNWAYTMAPLPTWLRWLSYAVSFATVLPAIFITSDLVEPLFGRPSGALASEHDPAGSGPPPNPSPVFLALGLAMTAAPLVWPRYFFPAVWLGPILLLDPLLEKARIRSLSSGIRSGNRRRIWSLMLGGLLCGFLWEFMNYWAGSKWIYTIPFFGKWKAFEMPTLGFLGFPPFALECWILYHGMRAVPTLLKPRAARVAWWFCLGALSILIFRGIDRHTVVGFAENAFREAFSRSDCRCAFG